MLWPSASASSHSLERADAALAVETATMIARAADRRNAKCSTAIALISPSRCREIKTFTLCSARRKNGA